ncbi:MAG: ferredoxin, partial [Verrucomicrobia bacterium]
FLKRTNSICTESSVGINTEVWSREGVIYRITPRRNDEVNDTWMPDSGRMLYKLVESENRLLKARSNGVAISLDEAHIRCAEILPTGKTVYIGSSYMSVEEQFLFKDLITQHPGELYWLNHIEAGDNLLISSDRTPNLRGAFITGLIKELPKDNLEELANLIENGQVQNIVVYHEDLTRYGISEAQLKKLNVIYLGTHTNATSEVARIVIPTLMVFEKSGTFVNQQFRLQKFSQAVPGPVGVMPDINTLNRIISLLKKENDTFSSIKLIWRQMHTVIPQFENLSYETIPDAGITLESSVFNHIDFPEGKTLHFEPKLQSQV